MHDDRMLIYFCLNYTFNSTTIIGKTLQWASELTRIFEPAILPELLNHLLMPDLTLRSTLLLSGFPPLQLYSMCLLGIIWIFIVSKLAERNYQAGLDQIGL